MAYDIMTQADCHHVFTTLCSHSLELAWLCPRQQGMGQLLGGRLLQGIHDVLMVMDDKARGRILCAQLASRWRRLWRT